MMRAPDRDLLTAEPVRISVAVPALVARAHEPCDRHHRGRSGEDALADQGVLADQLALHRRQRRRACAARVRGSRSCPRRAARRRARPRPAPRPPPPRGARAARRGSRRCADARSGPGSRSRRIRSRTLRVWRSAEWERSRFCPYMRRSASRSAVDGSSASSGSSTEPLELEIENALPASDRAADPTATTPSAVRRRRAAPARRTRRRRGGRRSHSAAPRRPGSLPAGRAAHPRRDARSCRCTP